MKSRDYKKLYELICTGAAVPAFVDNYYNTDKTYLNRDICQVIRRGKFDIMIFARGIGYGGIYPFEDDNGRNEFELFSSRCVAMNLEFYDC
jgi:hypothetical protein